MYIGFDQYIDSCLVLYSCTGSGDVVGGNLKLILGLIWTLILHYQISVVLSNPSDPESRASRDKDLGTPKENVLNYLEVNSIYKLRYT